MVLLDMNMPKGCEDCDLRDFGDGHCTVYCCPEQRPIYEKDNTRPKWCPIKGDQEALPVIQREAIKPTINEYGEAFCVCGENVGIIPRSKNLPKIRSKYCSECGRRMKWE